MATRNLVQNHVKVIYRLESEGLLTPKTCNFIQLPFESYERSVFHEIKRGGKSVLTNKEEDVVQFCNVSVERAMNLQIINDPATKSKTVKVTNDDTNPNVVFFKEIDVISNENAALITDIAVQLWMLIKTKQLNNKQLQQVLKKLTAVLIAHTKKNDMPALVKALLYTNPESGEYLAPLAALQDTLPKEMLNDFQIVIETGDLPSSVAPLSIEQFAQLRRSTKDYKGRALGDLREAVYEAQHNKEQSKRAQDILKKYFNMNLMQALDLLHLDSRQEEEGIELAEDLINTTLKYVARDQDVQLSAEEKQDILNEQLIDTFSNRLQ